MIETIRQVLTIAANERRMLYRQAKFWVLAAVGLAGVLLFMVVMTIASILESRFPGEFLLEGTDAYLALYFFSYAQAILILFVAADFRKAEEKNRLDQVMLCRPMTTANWVIGKYFGVVTAVLLINIFLMIIATIGRTLKMFYADAALNVLPFIKYFVIATMPSILFMTAFVFLLASLVRIQAATVIAGLGYIASILFYFHHDFLGLFDYGAFFAPIFSSDLIGFGNVSSILQQRLFFVLAGFTFLGITILIYPRLTQSNISRATTWVVTFFCLAAGIGTASHISQTARAAKSTFQEDVAYQKNWTAQAICHVLHYDLGIEFGGKSPLHVVARLRIQNPNEQRLDRLVFALNNELQVSEIRWLNGGSIEYQQAHQLLELELGDKPLQPGAVDSIAIVYAGTVDADAFMLDRLPDRNPLINKSNGPWTQPNESAWLSKDFCVLPAQCGWYPVPGAAGGYAFKTPRPKNFATASIHVNLPDHLTPVSQGKVLSQQTANGKKQTVFAVDTPVPAFSLNIGHYLRLATSVKDVEIELFANENHIAGYELFNEVADTCRDAIRQILTTIEDISGLAYPYKRLSLVEVPLHMQVYAARFGFDNILSQPGIIMLDEVTLASKRIKKSIERRTKRAQKRGRDDSPGTIKWDVFADFVADIFFSDRIWRDDGSIRSPVRNYVNSQIDMGNPILERALELQLYEACERQIRDTFFPDRWNEALSSYDRMRRGDGDWIMRRRYETTLDSVLDRMTTVPLSQVRPEVEGKLYPAIVDFKAAPIFEMLRKLVGEDSYAAALANLVEKHRYQRIGEEPLLQSFASVSNENVRSFYESWFHEATFPGYRILEASAEKIDTGEMAIKYLVKTRILNGEKGRGFVRLICHLERDKIRRSYELASYEEKEIQFTVSRKPETIELVPYFSRNRGPIKKQISISNRITKTSVRDTVFTISSELDSSFFVVDDQDDGFFTPTFLPARYLRPPSKGASWWQGTDGTPYGKYFMGWQAKRSGSGDYPASWVTHVPKDGDYEVSFYYRVDWGWVNRRKSKLFHLRVTDDDGAKSMTIRPEPSGDGWIPLGLFSFKKTKPAIVELLDEGDGFLVADAVRWEFIE